MNFRLDPQAAIELEIAIDYYDSISPRLGHAFAKSVYAAIQQAIEFPEAWTHIHQDTRRVVAKKFPYCVIYQKDENSIIVLAIMNQHQKPNYWQDRLQ